MDNKEQSLRSELTDLQSKLQDPDVYASKDYPKIAKRLSDLEAILGLYTERTRLREAQAAAQQLSSGDDAELAELASVELEELQPKIAENESQLQMTSL
jgi:protein subunit release factor A